MTKANRQLLYRETHGAGNDDENNNPNGIVVTLSHWSTDANAKWETPDFFLLSWVMMINREVHSSSGTLLEFNRKTPNTIAKQIRDAIAYFDMLVADPVYQRAVEDERTLHGPQAGDEQ